MRNSVSDLLVFVLGVVLFALSMLIWYLDCKKPIKSWKVVRYIIIKMESSARKPPPPPPRGIRGVRKAPPAIFTTSTIVDIDVDEAPPTPPPRYIAAAESDRIYDLPPLEDEDKEKEVEEEPYYAIPSSLLTSLQFPPPLPPRDYPIDGLPRVFPSSSSTVVVAKPPPSSRQC